MPVHPEEFVPNSFERGGLLRSPRANPQSSRYSHVHVAISTTGEIMISFDEDVSEDLRSQIESQIRQMVEENRSNLLSS